MKSFLPHIFKVLLAFLVLSFSACQTLPAAKHKGVTHVAVIWLKRHGNAADRQTLIHASASLKTIPGVQSLTIGPVLPSHRAPVDSSYDLALVMQFPNEQALRNYTQSPVHKKAVKEVLMPLVRKFVVYDFVNQ